MLLLEPTEGAAGVTLWGDCLDLDGLRETIYHLADEETLGGPVSEFLLGLAYDVRHASQGDRLEQEIGTDPIERVGYRGVRILWPFFLVQLSLLRAAASYKPTRSEHQADLYRLEGIANDALVEYDSVAGRACIELLPALGNLPKDYLVEFISVLARRYVSEGKSGKPRFRKLPALLRQVWWMSDEYEAFKAKLESVAREKGCSPHELGDSGEWPDFRW